MAQDFMLFAGNSHLAFARAVARELDVPLHEPDESDERGPTIKWFSNGNGFVDIKCDVRDRLVFVIQTQATGRALIGKNPDGSDRFGPALSVSDMIMELYWLVDTLTCAGAIVKVVMPYMPYIRSDKLDHPRASIGAKIFADQLTAAGARGILLLEPHFPQIHGFFDRHRIAVDTLNMKPIFGYEILATSDRARTTFVAPDIGEAKHLGPFVSMLRFPIAIINKDRPGDDEKARAQQMTGSVEGRDCWVIDDETMSCGTLLEAANFCLANGARSLRAAIAHPVLTSMDGLRKVQEHPLISELHVLDGIPVSPEKLAICPKLRVRSVAREFAGALRILAAPAGEGHSMEAYRGTLYQPLNDLLARG